MISMESRVGGHALLGGVRHTLLRAVRANLLRVRRIRRRVLGISRLRRRHTVVVHRRSAVISRAVGAIRHVWVWGRRAVWSRARVLHKGSRVGAAVVRVADACRGLRYLLRLLRLLRRWRGRRSGVMARRRGRRSSSQLLLARATPVILIWSHLLLFLPRARLPGKGGRLATKGLTVRGIRVRGLWRRVDLGHPLSPPVRARRSRWTIAKHRLRSLGRRWWRA
jgi:hypothetical protein